MVDRQIEFKILRYDPDSDDAPHWQSYSVPCDPDWVVLDAINWIKDNVDESLSYRWSCHMAVCGSCGMMVNGEPTLSCKAFLRDYPDTIEVEALNNFPIERDLVVVLDRFMESLAKVKPYIIPKEERTAEDGTYTQTPAQLKAFKQYSMCINCTLCYAACPQVGLEDGFLGPAALALAHRYNLDSRDVGRSAREDVLTEHDGVWACSFVGACSQVCPKDVDPAAAIQQAKIASTIDYFVERLLPGRSR